ncbi:MAG: LptF/LptG family permease [Kiritimatiellia bacterium]|jgi:lipopolysaccharide export system permease protein
MRLITRYLLKAFLRPLVLCLISFNVIYIIFDLFENLSRFIDAKVPAMIILRYYGGLIATYSIWFVPASCLLATLYTMWQLSHHSELTAMRASGISFVRLAMPFVVVALFMTLLTFLNTELIMPEAGTWSERLKEASFIETPPEQREKRNFKYTQTVSDKSDNDGSVVRRTWLFAAVDPSTEVTMSRPNGQVTVTQEQDGVNVLGWRAKKAEFLDGVWWFHEPEKILFDIDGQELPRQPDAPPTASLLPMHGLSETPRAMMLEQRHWELYSLADMFHYLKTKKIGDNEKWCEFWHRLSSPWACVVITLFAIPAGISTGRQSVIKGVIIALAAFFSFYALTLALKFFGNQGWFPPALAALLPNLVFLCIGTAMYRKLT